MKKKDEEQPVNRKSNRSVKKVTKTRIRNLAHSIYLKRVKEGKEGDADSDWYKAAEELYQK